MRTLTLIPAYGRDYKAAKAAKADFSAGKDFLIQDFFSGQDGRLANCRDLSGQYDQITIRFNRLQRFAVVNI